jgi:type 1 glutamine amidotransferase
LTLAVATAFLPLVSSATAKSKTPKHVLVVSLTAGFHHSSVPLGQETIQKLGQQTGLWDTEFATTEDEVKSKLTADHLKGVDLVIFNNTTGDLPMSDADKKAFLDWIQAGHGFVGMHAATDTFHNWADYGKMIGGYFDSHPWHQKIKVKVEDAKFPGVKPFAESGEVTDEIYQFNTWSRDDKHVIMSVDNASIDVTKGKRSDNDYAVAWSKMYGKGRVFYTSLGHEEAVWNDPRYQEHITGGIKWALGLVKANAKPAKK